VNGTRSREQAFWDRNACPAVTSQRNTLSTICIEAAVARRRICCTVVRVLANIAASVCVPALCGNTELPLIVKCFRQALQHAPHQWCMQVALVSQTIASHGSFDRLFVAGHRLDLLRRQVQVVRQSHSKVKRRRTFCSRDVDIAGRSTIQATSECRREIFWCDWRRERSRIDLYQTYVTDRVDCFCDKASRCCPGNGNRSR
jgi:hypothetical protein